MKNAREEFLQTEETFRTIIEKLIQFIEAEIKVISEQSQAILTPAQIGEFENIVADLKILASPITGVANPDEEKQFIGSLHQSFLNGQFSQRLQVLKKMTTYYENVQKLHLLYNRSGANTSLLHNKNNFEANLIVLVQRAARYPLVLGSIKNPPEILQKTITIIESEVNIANEIRRTIEDIEKIKKAGNSSQKFKPQQQKQLARLEARDRFYCLLPYNVGNINFGLMKKIIRNLAIFSDLDKNAQKSILNLLFSTCANFPNSQLSLEEARDIIEVFAVEMGSFNQVAFEAKIKSLIPSAIAKKVTDRLTKLGPADRKELGELLYRVLSQFDLNYTHESIVDFLVKQIEPAIYARGSSFHIYYGRKSCSDLFSFKWRAISENSLQKNLTAHFKEEKHIQCALSVGV